MQKENKTDYSSFGRSVCIRFNKNTYERLQKEFMKDQDNEQFAFALFTQAKISDGTIIIIQDIFLLIERT